MGFGTWRLDLGTFLAWDPTLGTTVPPFVEISFVETSLEKQEKINLTFKKLSLIQKALKKQFSNLPPGLWRESRAGH